MEPGLYGSTRVYSGDRRSRNYEAVDKMFNPMKAARKMFGSSSVDMSSRLNSYSPSATPRKVKGHQPRKHRSWTPGAQVAVGALALGGAGAVAKSQLSSGVYRSVSSLDAGARSKLKRDLILQSAIRRKQPGAAEMHQRRLDRSARDATARFKSHADRIGRQHPDVGTTSDHNNKGLNRKLMTLNRRYMRSEVAGKRAQVSTGPRDFRGGYNTRPTVESMSTKRYMDQSRDYARLAAMPRNHKGVFFSNKPNHTTFIDRMMAKSPFARGKDAPFVAGRSGVIGRKWGEGRKGPQPDAAIRDVAASAHNLGGRRSPKLIQTVHENLKNVEGGRRRSIVAHEMAHVTPKRDAGRMGRIVANPRKKAGEEARAEAVEARVLGHWPEDGYAVSPPSLAFSTGVDTNRVKRFRDKFERLAAEGRGVR